MHSRAVSSARLIHVVFGVKSDKQASLSSFRVLKFIAFHDYN